MRLVRLEHVCRHVKDKKVTRNRQHGFTRGKSCLTKPIALCDKITGFVDEEKAVDVIHLDFSYTVFHDIFVSKLGHYSLDEREISWVKNQLDDRTQSKVFNATYSWVQPGICSV